MLKLWPESSIAAYLPTKAWRTTQSYNISLGQNFHFLYWVAGKARLNADFIIIVIIFWKLCFWLMLPEWLEPWIHSRNEIDDLWALQTEFQ